MLLGPRDPSTAPSTGITHSAALPLIAGLLGVAALGIAIGPLSDLLNAATLAGAP